MRGGRVRAGRMPDELEASGRVRRRRQRSRRGGLDGLGGDADRRRGSHAAAPGRLRRTLRVALATAVIGLAIVGAASLSLGYLRGGGSRAAVGTGAGDRDQGARKVTGEEQAAAGMDAARDFLDRYVDPEGRVVRPDDERDTVSEGQAYGMLLAAAVGDRERFDGLWQWARDHLLQSNGLLAWRWAAGTVVDSNAAADADLDTAHALLLAARRFDQPEYEGDAIALGQAILANETVTGPDGRLILVAGPWAREGDVMVNPSYTSPVAYELLGQATRDARWRQLTETGIEQLRRLTEDGSMLPPDWARLDREGNVAPAPAPGQETIRYGYEAFRVLPRLAGACTREARDLAAALWMPVSQTVVERAETHHLDGRPEQSGSNANLLVAGAAAAHAAGQSDRRDTLLTEADGAQQDHPAYYLGAWTALGHLLLEGDRLGGCPDAEVGELTPTTTTPAAGGTGDEAAAGAGSGSGAEAGPPTSAAPAAPGSAPGGTQPTTSVVSTSSTSSTTTTIPRKSTTTPPWAAPAPPKPTTPITKPPARF